MWVPFGCHMGAIWVPFGCHVGASLAPGLGWDSICSARCKAQRTRGQPKSLLCNAGAPEQGQATQVCAQRWDWVTISGLRAKFGAQVCASSAGLVCNSWTQGPDVCHLGAIWAQCAMWVTFGFHLGAIWTQCVRNMGATWVPLV